MVEKIDFIVEVPIDEKPEGTKAKQNIYDEDDKND